MQMLLLKQYCDKLKQLAHYTLKNKKPPKSGRERKMSEETRESSPENLENSPKIDEINEDRGLKEVAKLLNSVTDFVDGLKKVFDFSKEHNSGTKFLNVMGVTGFDILWLIGVLSFLVAVIGFSTSQLPDLLAPLYLSTVQNLLPQTFGRSPAFIFFFACIMAPLWEEIIFRLLPLRLVLLATDSCRPFIKNGILGIVAISASIIFGLVHFGVVSILIQGVGGGLYCWLYLRNKSILSSMLAHSIWNFTVIFGLPILMS